MANLHNDKKLVESLKKGDSDAFDELFGNYANRLFAFSFKYLRSKEDAEELVQDVFLKVWENRKKLKEEASFQSYLFTIAYNQICNIFRKRVHKRKYNNQLVAELSIGTIRTEESIDFNSLLEQVDRLILLLPAKQQLVFEKSRKDGLSTQQISKELNLSPGTVDNYISSTVKFLKTKLGKNNLHVLLFVALYLIK